MREIAFEEFTNKHNDDVLIRLSEDSFGGFHLIVKSKRLRRTEEHRVSEGVLIALPVGTVTDETSHTQLPTERAAMVEFKMACMMNNMPGFGSDEFQAWLRETTTKEEA